MKNLLQKSKCAFAVFMMSALSCPAVWAEDAAQNGSSVTLEYQDVGSEKFADMIMNTINVTKSADSTYFGIMDWNCYQLDGEVATAKIRGGYCGFQQDKGYITRSGSVTLWDADLPYSFEEACDSFRYSFSPSGDMEGLSTSYHCDYAESYWYTIVSRVWNEDGNSKFGFWYLDHTNEFWLHAVTYVYPSKSLVFENKVSSFIDDFAKVGVPSKSSTMILGPAVTRTLDGAWNVKKSAEAFGTYGNNNFSANTAKGAFVLSLGGAANSAGTVSIDASSSDFFTASNIKSYLFEPLSISSISYADDVLNWDILINRLPQFSWKYSVKDISTNEVVLSASNISSNDREAEILFTKNGTYEITLTLTDIFDNVVDTSFIQKITDKESEPEEISCLDMLNGFTLQPTGVNIEVPVEKEYSVVELKIVDKEGNIAVNQGSFGPQRMHGVYNHSLYLNTYGLPLDGEYFLVASIDEKKCVSKFSAARGIYDEQNPVADEIEGIKYVYATQYSTLLGFESNADAKAEVSLVSMYGWTAKKETISLQKGLNSYVINVNGLSFNEICTVIVKVNGKTYTEKFIVK